MLVASATSASREVLEGCQRQCWPSDTSAGSQFFETVSLSGPPGPWQIL